jgi:hypothetical protein
MQIYNLLLISSAAVQVCDEVDRFAGGIAHLDSRILPACHRQCNTLKIKSACPLYKSMNN